MNERFEYTVDFKGVHSRTAMYTVILDSLDFPEWCGVTLDSIWDCLTDMLDDRVTIILENFDCMEKYDKTMAEKLYDIFKESKERADRLNVNTYKIFVVRHGIKTEII